MGQTDPVGAVDDGVEMLGDDGAGAGEARRPARQRDEMFGDDFAFAAVVARKRRGGALTKLVDFGEPDEAAKQ